MLAREIALDFIIPDTEHKVLQENCEISRVTPIVKIVLSMLRC